MALFLLCCNCLLSLAAPSPRKGRPGGRAISLLCLQDPHRCPGRLPQAALTHPHLVPVSLPALQDDLEDPGTGVDCVYTFLKIIWVVMIFCVSLAASVFRGGGHLCSCLCGAGYGGAKPVAGRFFRLRDARSPLHALQPQFLFSHLVFPAAAPQVLFFDLPFGKSVWIGVTVGVTYAVVSRLCVLLAHCAFYMHSRRVQPAAGRAAGEDEAA